MRARTKRIRGTVIKPFAWIAALLFAGAVQANPLVDKLVNQLEASPEGCTAVAARDRQRQQIEADLVRVKRTVPVPADVQFRVMDCEADGFVHQGKTVVLSTRLTRMNAAQRFFIIAHELGHVRLAHHGAIRSFVSDIVSTNPDEALARRQIASSLAKLSYQHEFDADAFAVRAMQQAGVDPDQAARIFDSIPDDSDNGTHPSAQRRAMAIRALMLKPVQGPGAPA